MKVSGQTVIVTGGASGLGEATVRHFVNLGAKVIIADLNETSGKRIAIELKSNVRFCKTNICDEASVQYAIDAARNEFGGLKGLVNCAGIGIAEKLISKEGEPASLKNFSQVVGVNLIGTFNMIRLCAAAMIKNGESDSREGGVIVNTASVAAFEGQIGQLSYAASKGGIVSMTLPLARELSQHRIRVLTIAPGIFDTPMLAGLPEKVRLSLGQQVPFPSRLGEPREFAALVQHIFENEMLNGEVIRLDGALRMTAR